MEPRIQYARTSDGVSIAYWSLGEGPALIEMAGLPFGHIQLEWQIPEWRRWRQRLAEDRRVAAYDTRGTGLSERVAPGPSLDQYVLDLEAVVNHLGLGRFGLFGGMLAGPVAIAYAARPGRVSHLILWCTNVRIDVMTPQPQPRWALRTAVVRGRGPSDE